jgi:hypothetical protein
MSYPPLLKRRTQRLIDLNTYGVLTIDASQPSMNLHPTAVRLNKQYSHQCLPRTYVHNICPCALPRDLLEYR